MRWILSSLIFVSLNAFAGNEVGNGGNVVNCKDKLQMLDLYEAKTLRGVELDSELGAGSDPYQIARDRLTLLDKFDAKSVKVYRANLARLQKDISLENDIQLVPIDDSGHAFVPKDPECKVTQLAALRKKPLPGEKRLLVNNSLFKKMVPVQQAALLLHEAIYERLALLGEKDSSKARYLVSYLMSPGVRASNSDTYWKMIKDLRLSIYR